MPNVAQAVSYKLGSLSHRNWILWLAHIRPLNHGQIKIRAAELWGFAPTMKNEYPNSKKYE